MIYGKDSPPIPVVNPDRKATPEELTERRRQEQGAPSRAFQKPDDMLLEEFQAARLAHAAIFHEFLRARTLHSSFNSSHEGYGILLEEVDELWDAVKANDIEHAKEEAIQVAAMALAFIVEVGDK